MNIVNIHGGLGNQMFQYAFGRAVEHISQVRTLYAVDMFKGYRLHNGLEIQQVFDLPFPIAGEDDLRQVLGLAKSVWVRRCIGKLASDAFPSLAFVQERGPSYMPDAVCRRDGTYFQGYWQSAKYFSVIQSDIRRAFVFRDADEVMFGDLAQRLKATNSVALHVRRGDYLIGKNVDVYARCDIGFYRRALECLSAKFGRLSLYIFGDDPEWAYSSFSSLNHDFEIVDLYSGRDSYKDMLLMSLAHHNIISNSTFGWWAAWLSSRSGKVVVAPSNWYVGKYAAVLDMIPDEWIRVAV